MNSASNRSIPELVSDAFAQLAKLLGNEIELAKAEMMDKLAQVGRAGAMIGAGAVIMIPALVMLLFAVAAGLMHAGLSDPVAYLITGVGAAAISGGLIAIGINRLSGDALTPSMTLEQVQRDKVAVKEMVR
ncbi:MAG TPA: phage holin family protein [Bradyrhizobium sp.]|nr:phage holin family protein [Bradyrhizobium sp.]